MEGTSGAVMDHETAEAEREAEKERLAAEQADLDNDPSQTGGGPEEPEPEEEPEEPQGPYVEAHGQLSLNVGGKRPTGASIRLTGGKIDIPSGEFKKGDEVVFMVRAAVTELAFVDILDPKTHQIVGCDRRHKARIRSVELLENE